MYSVAAPDVVAAGFKAYEMEDDVTRDLAEFGLANAIYAALVEGHACEISARYAPMFAALLARLPYCCCFVAVTPWTMHQRMQAT